MLVYISKITNRCRYIFTYLFNDICKIEIQFTTSREEFINSSLPKINYSKERLSANEFYIENNSLLFEDNIETKNIDCIPFKETKAFYPTSNSDFPFDIFAASFYLITRYEEYTTITFDNHNRFSAKQSLAYKEGFLHLPVIEIWTEYLKEELLRYYPNLKFGKRQMKFLSTIDVDNGYWHKGKTPFRTIMAYAKSIIKLDFKDIKERTKVLLSKQKDPFDNYYIQQELQKKYSFDIIYFILFSPRTKYDHCISPKSNSYKKLINRLKSFAQIGIHPSYFSGTNPTTLLRSEIENLSEASSQEIKQSRMHFLRFNLPETYRNLLSQNITHDYTMGYADEVGFRASTSTPFYFFDLEENKVTNLKITPFCVMDGTLFNYKKLSPEQGLEEIRKLYEIVRSIKGMFCFVWHDCTFSQKDFVKGWSSVYKKVISMQE